MIPSLTVEGQVHSAKRIASVLPTDHLRQDNSSRVEEAMRAVPIPIGRGTCENFRI